MVRSGHGSTSVGLPADLAPDATVQFQLNKITTRNLIILGTCPDADTSEHINSVIIHA